MKLQFIIDGITDNPDNSTTVVMHMDLKQFGQGTTQSASLELNLVNPALRQNFTLGDTVELSVVKFKGKEGGK